MRFVDHCKVKVVAGDGGNGVIAFRREKFIPFGGPSGGDGGKGGDVVFIGDEGMSTLLDFTHARLLSGERGDHGRGSDMYGRAGKDRVEKVPVGTQIRDTTTGALVADITAHEQVVVVAKGGKGGRGNIHFATPYDRAPRRAEKGEPGEQHELEMELKVLADVGLLGFPNVGKSTFVSTVSAARPRIADYPFTTLTPTLGVVEVGGGGRAGGATFVIADIPGLIPGASEGIGLGIRFLKHVERTRALLHLVSLDAGDGREPVADYKALRKELKKYSPDLAKRPEVVVLSKADVTEVREAFPSLQKRFAKIGIELHLVSAATRDGVEELVNRLFRIVRGLDVREEWEAAEAKKGPERAGAKKAPVKKAPVKKTPAKTPANKTPAKKVPAKKKAAAKKAPAKKVAAKKKPARPVAKRAPAKKPAKKNLARKKKPTRPVAKKSPARNKAAKSGGKRKPTRAVAKKAPAKKAPARKPTRPGATGRRAANPKRVVAKPKRSVAKPARRTR